MDSSEAALEALIDQLHEGRLRVWSIVITFFGDAVVPRGGTVWLGCLRAVMERLRIEPGTLGAAMSRLTADGWLVRTKKGRNTYYALDARGAATFAQASRRIYGSGDAPWTGEWDLRVTDGGPREGWARQGWGRLDGRLWVRPHAGPEPEPAARAVRLRARTLPGAPAEGDEWVRMLEDAFDLEPVAEAYRAFQARFEALAISDLESLSPLSAMAARTLLIHEFRRTVLKDPELPRSLRRQGWAGDAARGLASDLYRRLAQASEAWLTEPDRTPEGPLPEPSSDVALRFSLHQETSEPDSAD